MKKIFRLEGLDCANCLAKMEHAIKALDGVTSVSINFMTTKMILEGDDAKFDSIVKDATAIVKRIEPGVIVKKG